MVPFATLPLWAPGSGGFMSVDVSRSVASGLSFRPLEDTVRDTHAWLTGPEAPGPWTGREQSIEIPPPLTAEREAELLDEWRSAAH